MLGIPIRYGFMVYYKALFIYLCLLFFAEVSSEVLQGIKSKVSQFCTTFGNEKHGSCSSTCKDICQTYRVVGYITLWDLARFSQAVILAGTL